LDRKKKKMRVGAVVHDNSEKGNAKDPLLIPPHHPLFLKNIDFYYKRVIRGMRGGCVEGLFRKSLGSIIYNSSIYILLILM
jgi:hypothetical protein